MSTTATRQSNYMTEVRKQAKVFLKAYQFLKTAQLEYNSQDYGTTLADGVDGNEGITAAMIGSVVFDTTNAIEELMNQGHATNLTTILE